MSVLTVTTAGRTFSTTVEKSCEDICTFATFCSSLDICIPESFNVLLRELQALNLSIELLEKGELEEQEAIILERYSELEKLEGQYDIELDIPSIEEKVE